MPSPQASPEAADPPILFRPSKKRKLYRQREVESASEPDASAAPAPAVAQSLDELIASAGTEEKDADAPSLAEILRLRKQQRRAKGGVVVGMEGRHGHERDDEEDEAGASGGDEPGAGVVRRFAPQTGVVGRDDVDRHMMAYIDSELAKRRQLEGQAHAPPTNTSQTPSAPPSTSRDDRGGIPDVQREPAALGKLLEIDLGDEARDRNVQRTEQARRRMGGEAVEEEGDATPAKGRVRLGRDGKPWRGRKRRGSEDVKRDKLVEEFLRENRLDNIYDEVPTQPPAAGDDGQAADDVLAEAFRREFLDAVAARQRKKPAPAQPPARGPGGKRDEELKGPKLGGSRSARAAMRETLLKNAKK